MIPIHCTRPVRLFVLNALLVAAALVSTTVVASAHSTRGTARQQHQNGAAYAYWQFQGPGNDLWHVDQIVWIDQKAPYTYWAQSFQFTGSDDGGYLGLQTNGSRFDGTTGELAIFSLWNANGMRGPSCGTFSGEGSGLSCRIPLAIATGVQYRLRVWRLETDASGTWWGAWLYANDTRQDYHIGDLRVPAANHRLVGQVMNFTEYFGSAVPCDQVPQSIIELTQPAANLDTSSQTYAHYSHFSRFAKLDCGAGSGTAQDYGWTQGVRLVLGSQAIHQVWLPLVQRQ